MWSSNVCTTLNRSPTGYYRLVNILRPFTNRTIGQPASFRQLVASSFYRARAILKYVFGKKSGEFRPILNNYSAAAVRNVSETPAFSSLLGRLVVGKQYPIRRFNAYFENAHFRAINRRNLTGTGLTLGLVGVCVKTENGYPKLLDESKGKTFAWNSLFQTLVTQTFELKELREDISNVESIQFGECISKGCNGVVYKAQIESKDPNDGSDTVAVKMLFNYDIESVASRIISATVKECVPYNGKFGDVDIRRKKLPPHPNIVKILAVFADYFKSNLQKSSQLYPHALPLQYGGYGRNMTLFIVEKLYDMTLSEYLDRFPPTPKVSLAILTQSLDAIDFLNRINGISHRDLKADNILVSLADRDLPWVVISDFGLCSTSLVVPFQTEEVCRGGNRALMAPEIVNAIPAPGATLNYTKSDLWALGTMAYEIFGADNPFYRRTSSSLKLDSANYRENQLPPFPQRYPLLTCLLGQILRRNPNERPTTQFAAELCQLLFHMGSKNIEYLSQITSKEHRERLVDEWFKVFLSRSLYQVMNGVGRQSNRDKMKIIFLAKMQTYKVKALFETMGRL